MYKKEGQWQVISVSNNKTQLILINPINITKGDFKENLEEKLNNKRKQENKWLDF